MKCQFAAALTLFAARVYAGAALVADSCDGQYKLWVWEGDFRTFDKDSDVPDDHTSESCIFKGQDQPLGQCYIRGYSAIVEGNDNSGCDGKANANGAIYRYNEELTHCRPVQVCRDGCGYSGIQCAPSSYLERIKNQGSPRGQRNEEL